MLHDGGDLLSFTAEEEWGQVLGQWSTLRSTPQVRRLILAGVPATMQARMWHVALVQGGREDEASFERASATARELRERLEWDWDGSLRKAQPQLDDLMVVTADVPRTMPDAQRQGTLDAAQLTRLLDAFIASQAGADNGGHGGSQQSGSGYTQGMADVAARLLKYQLPTWQVYACLHAFTRRTLLRAVMGLDHACWDALGTVYTTHLKRAHPSLAAHLEAVGMMPFFFLPEWLVALWTRSLAPDAAALAWNLLLVEGDAFFCLSCAVGVSCAIAPDLLACDDLAECRDICRDAPRCLSLDDFKQAALSNRELDPALMLPLAPWDEAKPADTMFEL